jgi:hypothetical protein
MEPFEWLLLGVGLAVGSLLGSQGKGLVRSAAKGYLTVEEKTRMWTANMREDFHDAVEEARYERDEEMTHGAAASDAALAAEPARASNGRKRGSGTRGGGAASGTRSRTTRKTGTRGGGARKRGGNTGRRGRNAATETGGAA